MTPLVKGVNKERSRPSRPKEMIVEIISMIQSPENDLGVITLQGFPNTAVAGSWCPYFPSLMV